MVSSRRPYTLDEDNLLLEWIIKSKLFYCLRGRNFWVDMANANIFEERTWQSLQNRFEKKILPDITNPRYTLSDLDKYKIQLAWEQTANDFDSDECGDNTGEGDDNTGEGDDNTSEGDDNAGESDDNVDEHIDCDEISSSTHCSEDLNDTIVSSDESEHVSSTIHNNS